MIHPARQHELVALTKKRRLSPPLVVSLLLHVAVGAVMFGGWTKRQPPPVLNDGPVLLAEYSPVARDAADDYEEPEESPPPIPETEPEVRAWPESEDSTTTRLDESRPEIERTEPPDQHWEHEFFDGQVFARVRDQRFEPVEIAKPVASPARTVDAAPTPSRFLVKRVEAQRRSGSCPEPEYPTRALRRGLQGQVILLVTVDAIGNSRKITLRKSSGHGVLDERAIKTVERWEFVPAREDGRPVDGRILVPIRFRLPAQR